MIRPTWEEFRRLAEGGARVPVYGEILADGETPVTVLKRFCDRPFVFLLESVEGGEKWGRYTFIGTDPRAVVRLRAREVVILQNGSVRRVPHHGDPLGVLRGIVSEGPTVSLPHLPRFCGGAVGYFNYEAVGFFEDRLRGLLTRDEERDLGAFMITDTVIVFDRVRHTLKVVSYAAVEEGDGDAAEAYGRAVGRVEGMISALGEARGAVTPSLGAAARAAAPSLESDVTPAAFRDLVRRAKEHIVRGDAIQVVLSRRLRGEVDLPPLDLYRALRFINPSPYLFFLRCEDLHLIGSSPEVMVRLEGDEALLRPIAGTRRRGRTEQEDRRLADELLGDPKERAEHVMLVDLGRNDLGRVARTGSVQVTAYMNVERYSHVMHLVSTIRAELEEGKDAFDLFRACFPAGTLTGAPKVRAMEIIAELEPQDRGAYGGAVGYFAYGGGMDFCITIRTLELRGRELSLQVGAGIVADSDPQAEYEETAAKAAGMLRAASMAAAGLDITDF
ncbi:MAG TPA: anthranilate synthase component I family protein [Syntrophales bacterium]|nr:anthranilate synthase component I family protein [Syntrophales bacterium]